MLRHLQIRDFAIIDAVELDFAPGLTVLTGETGAGKSIIVDALELLAGGRAGADVVRAGAERADISATTDISNTAGELRHLLDEQAIAATDELILRRVVGNDGRSRAWLNGQPVPVQLLRSACELLLDIHGQHEFQSLVRPATQRQLLDGFGRLDALVAQVRVAHSHWLALLNRSLELQGGAGERGSRLELLRYQLQELAALQLKDGEVQSLNEERSRLANHGRLLESVRTALTALYESDEPTAHTLLARAGSALAAAAALDPQLGTLPPLLDEAAIRIKEAAHTLSQYLDALDLDPGRLDAVERRLAVLEELARKHRVPAAELPAAQAALAEELAGMESASADLDALSGRLAAALADYRELAGQLSARRAITARELAQAVSARMQELGMAGGRFLIDVEPSQSTEPAPHGTDRVEFRVSTNPGQPPRPIAKIASGGELARLSLAVQVCCAGGAASCMVFDEVDSGIGGAVAEIVGRELRSLGRAGQVLCVTHLPQVAAQAHQHLRVAKLSDGRSTRTGVTALDESARIEEIARMLGGVKITERARAHALEMLQQARATDAPAAPAAPAAGKAAAAPRRRTAKR